MGMLITDEALKGAAQAAQRMGFAINEHIVAPMVEAAFKAQFGPDVDFDNDAYKLARIERRVDGLVNVVNGVVDYVNTNVAPLVAASGEPKKESPYNPAGY